MSESNDVTRDVARPVVDSVRGVERSRFVARWPAYAVATFVGFFCVIVGAMWIMDHVVRARPVDETASVVALATVLRIGTIAVALSSVQRWGFKLPRTVVSIVLWACGAAQLAYPVAAVLIKSLAVVGAIALPDRGVGDLSLQGWLHLGAALTIFGIPGVLFILAAISHAHRSGIRGPWVPAGGVIGGVVALLLIGAAIG